MTTIGALVTAVVILSGSSTDGFQQDPLISYAALWALMQVGVLGLAATSVYGALSLPANRSFERWGLWATALTLCGFLVWTFIGQGGDRFDDSSMRILYELLKGTVAGVILLIGCILLFRKRAGIVLLHGGIGLMMVSEVLVGLHAEEAQMRIEEGSSSNFVEDIRSVELAFVRDLGDDTDQHTVIPQSYLREGETISNDELPVDVEVVEFIRNADIVPLSRAPEGVEQVATTGVGTTQVAIPVRASTGTDTDGAVDMAALYVTLRDKKTGEPIDTYLVSTMLDLFNLGRNAQTVTVDGTEYDVRLRFKRTYKPYTITLDDIRKEDYIGTNTPRDYSSYVRLQDESRGVDREIRIWMNNPLRYAGETFYQSSYTPGQRRLPRLERVDLAAGRPQHRLDDPLRLLHDRRRRHVRPVRADAPAVHPPTRNRIAYHHREHRLQKITRRRCDALLTLRYPHRRPQPAAGRQFRYLPRTGSRHAETPCRRNGHRRLRRTPRRLSGTNQAD